MKKEFNTESVIEWFESIKSKSKRSYVTFAIADFHPSIIKELLSKTIKYAQFLTIIEEKVTRKIYHARNT